MSEKIQITDSFIDMLAKLSEGNPEALSALMNLCTNYEKIDPDSTFGLYSPLFNFDSYGIYGSAIYVLWNDKCQRSPRKTIVLLRAVQLGFLPESKLKAMATDQMREVDLTTKEWTEIDDLVCGFLDKFQKSESINQDC